MKYNMQRILVEIHHGLGDVVQMIPLIENLKINNPSSQIDVIVASQIHADILKRTGFVNDYYILNLRLMSLKQIISFILLLRKKKYDIGFLSPISNYLMGKGLLYLSGCKCCVYEVKKTFILKRKQDYISKKNKFEHMIDRNLNLLRSLDLKIFTSNPHIILSETEIKQTLKQINYPNNIKCLKSIVICIGTNPVEKKRLIGRQEFDVKRWPANKYAELSKWLIKNGYYVIIIGGKRELRYSDLFDKNICTYNYIGKTSIIQSMALMSQADLVIGGDTGMLHLADALAKKTLTIFGPTDPELVGPRSSLSHYFTLHFSCQYCYGTNKLYKCTDHKCISYISLENIKNAVKQILQT